MYIWWRNILYIWWCRYFVVTSRINKKKSIRCILGIMGCCPIWLSKKKKCNPFLGVAIFHTELCESNLIHVYAVFIVLDHRKWALFISFMAITSITFPLLFWWFCFIFISLFQALCEMCLRTGRSIRRTSAANADMKAAPNPLPTLMADTLLSDTVQPGRQKWYNV